MVVSLRDVIIALALGSTSAFTPLYRGCSSVARSLPVVAPRESVVLAAGLVDKYGRPIGGAKSKDDEKDAPSSADYEEALGKLVFSSVDPTLDIVRDMDFYDERFLTWLDKKADDSDDLEERDALKSLRAMVVGVREEFFKNLEAGDGKTAADGDEGSPSPFGTQSEDGDDPFAGVPYARFDDSGNAQMQFGGGGGSDSDVLQGMRAVQGGGGQSAAADADAARRAAAVAAEQAKALEAQKTSYVALLAELLPLASNSEALSARVKDEYIKFDYTFMKVCDDVKKSDPDQAAKIDAVINEVNTEAARRIASATAVLQDVLQAGSPGAMETAMAKAVTQGRVDEAVLNLLDANIVAAERAGAAEPAAVMRKVRARADLELDKAKTPQERLMSQLLRSPSEEVRKELLQKAFEAKESLLLSADEDEAKEPAPDVAPDQFIEMCKAMIENFGNLAIPEVDGLKLQQQLLNIAAEAEQVSTALYGPSMSSSEQQDRMWSEGTVSVWDLEMMEQEAEIKGETMPWHGDVDEGKFLEKMTKGKKGGFDEKGVKKIGG